MNKAQLNNVNVISQELLPTPAEIKTRLPLSKCAEDTVREGRQTLQNILDRLDHRLFIVVGPCSIHDIQAAHEYAQKLKHLADELQDTLCLVMRVYFEKPRTTIGWKGLINDPYMDDSFRIEKGLYQAREFRNRSCLPGRLQPKGTEGSPGLKNFSGILCLALLHLATRS